MFAAGLALATLATTSVVVDFDYENFALLEPVVIIFLIATVMWVSNRLVWDCTLLGRTRDVSAMGLVEAIRQKVLHKTSAVSASVEEANGLSAQPKKPKKKSESESTGSFSVFEFMLGRNGKNTTPGLWVFYLAVAAFPIFGVGQWFVSASSSGFSIFLLFAVYLTSGLGLLMVTSLLGLKRYANKRGISVPEPVAMNWLFVGTMFLIGLLLLISFLPRPDLSSTMRDYLVLLSSEEKTSELAIGEDNDLPDPEEANQNAIPKPKRTPKNEQDGAERVAEDAPLADGKRGDASDPNSSEKKDGGGNETSDSKSGESKDGESKKLDSKDGHSDKRNEANDDARNEQRKNGQDEKTERQDENNNEEANQPDGKPPPEKKVDEQANKQPKEQADKIAKMQRPPAPSPPSIQPDSSNFRWTAYVLVGLIGVAIMIMYRNELLRLWQQLFGVRKKENETEELSSSAKRPARPRSFSSFKNPFASGMAEKVAPEKLMAYTIEAMRAWAYERGIETSGYCTADDLVSATESSIEKSHSVLRSFALIFNRTIYGDHPPDQEELKTIAETWRFMQANSAVISPSIPTKSALRNSANIK